MPKHTLIGMSGARASGGGSFNRLLVVFVQAPNADRALLDVIDQCLLSGQASAIGLVHMKKFDAIEGLRGWLAWAVVLSHLTYISGFKLPGLSQPLRMIALPAVLIFIIVSGFVITHLILEKEEPYPPILLNALRGFTRYFWSPVYWVSLQMICLQPHFPALIFSIRSLRTLCEQLQQAIMSTSGGMC